MKHYDATWSKTLIVVSILATGVCLFASYMATTHTDDGYSWLGVLPIGIIAACALFVIRGYTIEPDAILVHRPLWTTRLPRADLQSARIQPDAMKWSLRLCGNGGFFSFTGWYRNKLLGNYRAFVTDLKRTVVLKYSKRTIVLSPSDPEAFVRELGV
jgi:hypothetical protein